MMRDNEKTEKKNKILTAVVILVVAVAVGAVILFSEMGKIRNLDPYREQFKNLIEASYEINEIFYGEGLPVYSREGGLGAVYHSEAKDAEYLAYFKETVGKDYPESFYEEYVSKIRLYHWIYKDPNLTKAAGEDVTVCKYRTQCYKDLGKTEEDGSVKYSLAFEVFYAVVLKNDEAKIPAGVNVGEKVYEAADGRVFYLLKEYEEPEFEYVYGEAENKDFDVVRFDAKYKDITAMKEAAEQVYSMDYLADVYVAMFDGIQSNYGDSIEEGSTLYARYIEEANEEGGNVFLKKNNNESYTRFTEQRKYDFSTMKIKGPYSRDRVNVDIEAYGTYYSSETMQIETGKHVIRLSFVMVNGVWRLDTPTY